MAVLVWLLAAVIMPGFILIALVMGAAYVPVPAAKLPIICLIAAVPVYGGIGAVWWRAYRPAGRVLTDWPDAPAAAPGRSGRR
jgi:hypothetical protein